MADPDPPASAELGLAGALDQIRRIAHHLPRVEPARRGSAPPTDDRGARVVVRPT